MRGKGGLERHKTATTRITPAHAGKSCFCYFAPFIGWDHPRPCGEKRADGRSGDNLNGSPPPMRGKAARAPHISVATRITPAHAGKSALGDRGQRAVEDHPRPCGEKAPPLAMPHPTQGSPPPMRGKVTQYLGADQRAGITPAHAGKSSRSPALLSAL